MIKVVYDISTFGCVPLWPHTKSGIFRVAENLATELLRSGKCVLEFSAAEDFLHYPSVFQYRELPQFNRVPFSYSSPHYHIFSEFKKVNEQLDSAKGLFRLPLRVRRKAWHLAGRLANYSLFKPAAVDGETFKGADIFHSPYFAIPPQVREPGRVQSFLTVHDLIPILFPQYFESLKPGETHHLKPIINGIRRSDWVICVSQNTKNDLCNYRADLDPSRMFVTYLGASEHFFPCRDRSGIDAVRIKYKLPPGKYFLSVCTLEPRKNLPHLIRCFFDLIKQEKISDVNLVLVGNRGWKFEPILAELAKTDEDLRRRVVLTGRVDDEDMAALYSDALAFVYPSLYEGFGLPPLEAMQCGTPVITSNTSSLPEVVGDAGIMVDPLAADALCAAMLDLISHDERRGQLAQKSLARAKKFSWHQCGQETLSAYQKAVDSNS